MEQESIEAHDDLAKLIASSDVATIFLDRDMRILRYTPRIADCFNVIPADVGRPLPHITNRLDYPRLAEDAAKVFDTLQAMEREVRGKDGRDYIVRVHPYRTTEHRIEGAVMTFFDITRRRAAEQARRESEARLSTVFESLPVGVCVMDAGGRLLLSNRLMHRYLPSGVMPSRDPDRGKRWRAWGADGHLLSFDEFPGARALRGERVVPGIEMRYLQDDGREIWTQVASAPVSDEHGHNLREAMVVVNDIDIQKRAEAMLRENEIRLRDLMSGGSALAVWEMDVDGNSLADGPDWRGGEWTGALHPEDRARLAAQVRDAVARRAVVDARVRLRDADGGWRQVGVRVAPLVNVDGSMRRCIGMIVDADIDRPALPSDGEA